MSIRHLSYNNGNYLIESSTGIYVKNNLVGDGSFENNGWLIVDSIPPLSDEAINMIKTRKNKTIIVTNKGKIFVSTNGTFFSKVSLLLPTSTNLRAVY